MPGKIDCGQEFEYVVQITRENDSFEGSFEIRIEVYDGPVTFFGSGGEGCTRLIFSGSVEEYKAFIAEDAKEQLPS